MANWVRNTIMLTGTVVWAIFVVGNWARGKEVDAIVWGFPAALYFALNPSFKKGKQDGES